MPQDITYVTEGWRVSPQYNYVIRYYGDSPVIHNKRLWVSTGTTLKWNNAPIEFFTAPDLDDMEFVEVGLP